MAFLILALGFTQFSLRKEAIAAKSIHIGMLGGGGGIFFRQVYGKEWWPFRGTFVGVFTNVS